MGIRFYCPECDRRMNVKSFLAGKRGICPHCDARWDVPLESEIPEGAPKVRPKDAPGNDAQVAHPQAVNPQEVNPQAQVATQTAPATHAAAEPASTGDQPGGPSFESLGTVTPDPIDAAPDAVWYVRPASGGEFGPARGEVMRRWMEEGRVGADSMVWCEGWPEWQIAGPIFPSLTPEATAPTPDPGPTPNPVQVTTGQEPKSLASLNAIQKKTVESNGRVARQRSAGSGKSIAAVVILGLMIVTLFVVLIVVIQK